MPDDLLEALRAVLPVESSHESIQAENGARDLHAPPRPTCAGAAHTRTLSAGERRKPLAPSERKAKPKAKRANGPGTPHT